MNEDLLTGPGTLSERITRMFGRATPVMVRAIAKYLEKGPGEFDHQHLRTIAAAAPVIGDPQLVAQLIDEMPITQMDLSVKRVDIDSRPPGTSNAMA